jgi:ABC-2 type transport system permease protein
LPNNFTHTLLQLSRGEKVQVPFELSGDLSDINYMLAATYTYEAIVSYINESIGIQPIYDFIETPAGSSGEIDEFELYVPGLLILSIVMLMFPAAIAFVREPEQRTMIRLKLSHLKSWEFITGVSVIQVIIGFISAMITLMVAATLGFEFHGSWANFLIIITLTCLSIIGFSLIVAAITKTVNQVLVVGNFPLFLFMFFTGAMMPIHGPTLFSFDSYDFTLPGLMSPYHAVNALKKISIFQASLGDVWPEMVSLTGITILYFIIGGWLYRRQHLRLL